MNKKFVEEFNITAPGFVLVENTLNMRYDDTNVRLVIKEPGKQLRIRPFYSFEKACEFIVKYAKSNFKNFDYDENVKYMPMEELNTEYRVVDKDKCVSYGLLKESNLPLTNIVTDGITNYYSTSIKFNPKDFK